MTFSVTRSLTQKLFRSSQKTSLQAPRLRIYGWRTRHQGQGVLLFPTVAMRGGDFSALSAPIYDPQTYDPAPRIRQVLPGNIIPANRIDPIAKQLSAYYPAPQNDRLSQNLIFNHPNQEDVGRIN